MQLSNLTALVGLMSEGSRRLREVSEASGPCHLGRCSHIGMVQASAPGFGSRKFEVEEKNLAAEPPEPQEHL